MVCVLGINRLNNPGRRDYFLDGDVDAVRVTDQSPGPGVNPARYPKQHYKLGRPISPDHLPTSLEWHNPEWAVADIINPSGFPCVSHRFRQLIEELEPDTHQFFPLRIVNEQGDELSKHWLWVVCQRVDSVDREHTTMFLYKGVAWLKRTDVSVEDLPDGCDPTVPSRLVFNLSQIGAAHFWFDTFLTMNIIYCSDESANRIRDAKMTGTNLIQKEAV